MRERSEGRTLVARDEGDDADGVVIKLYGEETNRVISIIEQPFEPGVLLPPHVHENDVWLYVLGGEMHARVGDEVVTATPGCWVLKLRRIPHTMWNAGLEPTPAEHLGLTPARGRGAGPGRRRSRQPPDRRGVVHQPQDRRRPPRRPRLSGFLFIARNP
jgi:quercetin dioxygenase-like cupin family protein